jgi:ATP-dependent helicase HrpB
MARNWAKRARSLVKQQTDDAPPPGVLLAEGFPDNLAKRRDAKGEEWIAAGGRG